MKKSSQRAEGGAVRVRYVPALESANLKVMWERSQLRGTEMKQPWKVHPQDYIGDVTTRRSIWTSKIEQPCTSLQTLGGKPSPLKEWHLKRNCIAFAIGNSISRKKTHYTGVVPTSVFEGNSAWWELKDLAIHVELRNFQCQVFNTSLCVATHASHL